MSKRKPKTPAELRAEAEVRLALHTTARSSRISEEERRLLQELEIHQMELELQNDELRTARDESEESLERYTLLFDFAPIGYAILAGDGTIRDVNHVGASVLGRVRSGLIGQPFEAFLAQRDRSPFALLFLKTIERETKESCEVTLARPYEVPLSLQVMMRALTRGQKRLILLAFEDVTERKLREEQRERAERALREMDRRKDEFLAALSHELRNPLGAMRNSLPVLAHPETDAETAERARAIIDRQVSLLTRLVDDLLDVTRIARGKIQLHREVFDLEPLVRRSLEDHRPSFEASGIRLEPRVDPGPFWVDADAARLSQALGNVLGNAEKFTPRGGTVLVSLERAGRDALVLRVTDTGAGIDAETLPHVFDSFVQAPQTLDRSRGGLGLGLAMVRGLVELQGGTAQVTSDGPGLGTEVTIRLPLEEAPAAVAPSAPSRATVRSRRVIVIDDNADNAESMQFGLELAGHEVIVARDGKSALELARRFHPDVVVSDIGLPGMDGYAVARAFRADDELSGVYLVAVSGYTRPEDLERGASAGFDHYFGKPVELGELDAAICAAPVPGPPPRPISAPPYPLH
jgi:two-component system CheB/CheR fusion protein